ncbi:hypothetical protein WMY93_000086 [Mugilogobius chulae]|uniref:HotDog ACOT-type domain-containing protein n=1 Tax=Mugilogobius chulae TaxID=88201 RepID=A0AAW0Q6K7_9GOBI
MSSHASDVDRDPGEEEEEEDEEEEDCRNPTAVRMSQIVMPCHSNPRQELSVGQLLKWMDSTACLSAERHAGSPCVTASMDDIHLSTPSDLFLDRHWRVCHAYATFVTQRSKTGKKVMLKPLTPHSHTEQLEYSLAAERRRVRMLHDDIIRDLLSSCALEPGGGSEVEKAVSAVKTKVESVELVLPPHANHQVNTFGGQIMAWMVNVATIAASRLCQAHPTLRGIDMFKFRGPSSMEVGVRAEAYQEEGPNRHINSAFMIFEVLDKDGKPRLLPRIRPEPVEGTRRFEEATARKKIRLDSCNCISVLMDFALVCFLENIISREQAEVPLSVPWDPTNQVYLSYNNVSALKTLAAHHNWRLSSEKDQDPYVIALRSVTLPTHPRWRASAGRGAISYYNQASAELLLPLLSTDMAGLSSTFYHNFCSCQRYLTQRRLPSDPEQDRAA